MKAIAKISLTALLLFCLHASDAAALTIVTTYVGGAPPPNATGGGNLIEIVNAAARMWEAAYADPYTINIRFGWARVGDAGTHTLIEQGGAPNREITGIILFDDSGAVSFYLDPTPYSNEEYHRRTEEYQDLGAGLINVARLFSNPVGDAVGRTDLLSVVIHEMGHALGMCAANAAFAQSAGQGIIQITDNLPFAGTVIPLATNKAGVTSHFDAVQVVYGSVMAGIGSDERRLPSALDILANAQVSAFVMMNTDPQQTVPSRVSPARSNGRILLGARVQRR